MLCDSMLEGPTKQKRQLNTIESYKIYRSYLQINFMSLLQKWPNVNLRVGTNDTSSCDSSEIANNIKTKITHISKTALYYLN